MFTALAFPAIVLVMVTYLIWGWFHYDILGYRARREAADKKWADETVAWLRSMSTSTGEQPVVKTEV